MTLFLVKCLGFFQYNFPPLQPELFPKFERTLLLVVVTLPMTEVIRFSKRESAGLFTSIQPMLIKQPLMEQEMVATPVF